MSILSAVRHPLAAALCLSFLSGCAVQPCCSNNFVSPATSVPPVCVGPTCEPRTLIAAPTKLRAVGYGSTGGYTQYTHAQQKLMAMRAAQVDAYRNLAEQVYGFRVWGSTAVSAFATQSDSIRSYVDAFIRGARVVSMTSIADGNFEATVELELSQQFVDCFGVQGSCGFRMSMPACVAPGCTAPSISYISN